MSKRMTCHFLGVWIVVGAGVHAADIGTAFTYQGRLVRDGTPVNSSPPHCNLTFGLWDAADGGNQKGNSPQAASGVAVADGLFTLSLDFGAAGIDGVAGWLEITVQCPGDAMPTTLLPRLELKPAPHALHAVEAAALDLPYTPTESTSAPMLELTQTGDGPAATFDVGPNHTTGLPAVQMTNSGLGPTAVLEKVGSVDPDFAALEVRSDTGGPAARVWVQPQPEPPLPVAALEVVNDTDGPAATFGVDPEYTPAPAIRATNSGRGPAAVLEKVAGVDPGFSPALVVTNELDAPAATFGINPEFTPAPAIRATNSGRGPAAVLEKVAGIDPGFSPALEVTNELDAPAATFGIDPDFIPASAIVAINSGLGSAVEAVSGIIGPPQTPTIKATNLGSGSGLEVASGTLMVSSAPTISATNIGVGTAAYVAAASGTALHAVSAGGSAGYFEGAVTVTGDVSCASLAWGTSALGDDQGGAIELGNSLTTGNNPYIDFHRGVGLAQDYNVRLQNDADQQLRVVGKLATTGELTVSSGDLEVSTGELRVGSNLTVSGVGDVTVSSGDLEVSAGELRVGSNLTVSAGGNVTVSTGDLSVASGDLTVSTGDLAVSSGDLTVSSSGSSATVSATNTSTLGASAVFASSSTGNAVHAVSSAGSAGLFDGNVHVIGNLTKAYTTGTSDLATPIAYATISSAGGVLSGTPNVSSSVAANVYSILIAGESYSSSSYVTTVTTIAPSAARFATVSASGGQLQVRIFDLSGTLVANSFHFVTYKP